MSQVTRSYKAHQIVPLGGSGIRASVRPQLGDKLCFDGPVMSRPDYGPKEAQLRMSKPKQGEAQPRLYTAALIHQRALNRNIQNQGHDSSPSSSDPLGGRFRRAVARLLGGDTLCA
jgi:hypothetical protein